jgi:hypothetical protein
MTRVAYIATTNFESINRIGLKMLTRYAKKSASRPVYVDLSGLWDFYFPADLAVANVQPSVVKKGARFTRIFLRICLLRIRLIAARIEYMPLKKAEIIGEVKRLQQRFAHCNCEEVLDQDLLGFPLSSILFHDASLFLKIHDLHSLDALRQAELRRMALLLLTAYQVLARSSLLQRSYRLFAFEGYSLNMLLKLMMRQLGGELIFFSFPSHKNVSFDRIEFTADTLPSRRRRKCQYWESNLEGIHLTAGLLTESILDIETRLFKGGSHVYSPSLGANFFRHNPLLARSAHLDLPIVTVFTSSLDEFMATQHMQALFSQDLPDSAQIFTSQIEMLTALAQLATQWQSFQLVIRHHPRLGQAKDNRRSQYYEDLCYALDEIDSPFVHVIMPEDNLSSYWLVAWSSCVLNSWSNIGLESLRLGVPVLNLFSEYRSVCYWPTTLFPSLASFDDVKLFIAASFDRAEFARRQKHLLLLAHSFYTFMNVSTYADLDQDFLPGITETRDWEIQSFARASGTNVAGQTIIKSAGIVADRLINFLSARINAPGDRGFASPLLQRLQAIRDSPDV